MGNWFTSYFSGNAEPDQGLKNAEHSELRESIQKGGPTGLARHLDIRRRSCKEEPINLGIAGRPNTGKSSFINAILNVKDDSKRFHSEDSCENITAPRKYCLPIENQLLFFELPGIGSENWTKCEYVLKNQLWKYDYFFIVFDTVLHEDDLWFAQQLVKMNKPFVLVRSKVDLDIKMDCSEDASSKIIKLRKKTFSTIDKIDVLKANVGVCFISSFNDDIGDMAKLKNHIISNLKAKKFETVLYSLNALYKAINDKKYILLKKQILIVTTVVASISATRFSGFEVGVNIAILAMEIYHFINELGLCWKEKTSLIHLADSQIKCSELEKTNWKILRYMLQQSPKLAALIVVAATKNKFEIFGPIVGAVVTSALSGTIAYNFLTNCLDNFTHDSAMMYDHVVSRHIPRNTSIRAMLQLPNDFLQ
ncbi:interferon-gamma-inducible GTPase 10-like isoform X2 [Mytilus galloprovincialis]|uniref:interferon-gamma-inducible GTPase 10-like isoform X2 n=1 Tax=Mytilus galloprovincialis TaxID=29158 RepID=UPI003F7BC9AD